MLEFIDGSLVRRKLSNPALLLSPDWFCIAETDNTGMRGWLAADYVGSLMASPLIIEADEKWQAVPEVGASDLERLGAVYLQSWSMLHHCNELADFIATKTGGRFGIVLDIWQRLRANHSRDCVDLWMTLMMPMFGRQQYFHKFALLDNDSAPFNKDPGDVQIRADMEEVKRRMFNFMQLHQLKANSPMSDQMSGMVRSYFTMTSPNAKQTDLPCPVCAGGPIGTNDNTFFCASILSAMCAIGIEQGKEDMDQFGEEIILVDATGDRRSFNQMYPMNVDARHVRHFTAPYVMQMFDGEDGLRTYEAVLAPNSADISVEQKAEEEQQTPTSKESGHVIH